MEFQSYLSKPYQGRKSFLEHIIFPIFGEDNFESSYDIEMLDTVELRGQAARTGIRSIIRCGTIDIDLTPIEVFDITVSDRLMMDKNRVGVQAVIRRVMDTYSGAFMIIHYDNDVKWDWRFTFCQMKDKGEFTDNKRYTFLLGPNQSCRTAAQNFQKLADLHEDITIKDIVSAFDVEALSKSFFDGYKKHYERFVEFITGKRFVKEAGKFVEKSSHEPHSEYYPAFGSDDKAVRDYTKLLLARIVFLHFLQKKGWLGVPVGGKWGDGDEQFMKHLYEGASEDQKNDYLESVLEPLFFDALNGDRSSCKDVFDTKVVGKVRIPYLNGGLFSKDSLDEIVIRYPKEFFGDFLEFLYQYNFTIDENDPNEAQVGIDPEMLGKIFENLLEDNKDKGAFYTPKEIVQYMCQESLIACLVTKTGLDEERLRSFVKDPFVRVSIFTPDEQYTILGAILNVKICDPAIGSGAFPIGLLNELVRCKEAIYGDEKGRAEIKKEIIRDNIYGVDIEKGAVDIARLRFWLSLIVDEEEPLPLPNLDYKIMQGNSLLEWYDGVDLSHLVDAGETNIFLSGAEDLKDDLADSLKTYFDEYSILKKMSQKEHISEVIEKILDVAGVEIPKGIAVAENNQFFLWHTWFNEVFAGGGFDIVIGNPPYGATLTESDKEKYRLSYPEVQFKINTYSLFVLLSLPLLGCDGICYYILPNTILDNYFESQVRAKLLGNWLYEINDLNDRIFETAVVHSMILAFKKGRNPNGDVRIDISDDIIGARNIIPQSFFEEQPQYIFDVRSYENDTLLEKLRINSERLEDVLDVRQAIKTGNDKKYITSVPLGPDYKPILRGKDVHRFSINSPGLYVWYGKHLACPRSKSIFEQPKILIREAGSTITAAIDNENYYIMSSLYNAILKDEAFSMYYLLGLINSELFQFLMNKLTFEKTKGAFTKAKIYHYYNLPIKCATKEQQDEIEMIVKEISDALTNNNISVAVRAENNLNERVYSLYDLSSDEILNIKKNLSSTK